MQYTTILQKNKTLSNISFSILDTYQCPTKSQYVHKVKDVQFVTIIGNKAQFKLFHISTYSIPITYWSNCVVYIHLGFVFCHWGPKMMNDDTSTHLQIYFSESVVVFFFSILFLSRMILFYSADNTDVFRHGIATGE